MTEIDQMTQTSYAVINNVICHGCNSHLLPQFNSVYISLNQHKKAHMVCELCAALNYSASIRFEILNKYLNQSVKELVKETAPSIFFKKRFFETPPPFIDFSEFNEMKTSTFVNNSLVARCKRLYEVNYDNLSSKYVLLCYPLNSHDEYFFISFSSNLSHRLEHYIIDFFRKIENKMICISYFNVYIRKTNLTHLKKSVFIHPNKQTFFKILSTKKEIYKIINSNEISIVQLVSHFDMAPPANCVCLLCRESNTSSIKCFFYNSVCNCTFRVQCNSNKSKLIEIIL